MNNLSAVLLFAVGLFSSMSSPAHTEAGLSGAQAQATEAGVCLGCESGRGALAKDLRNKVPWFSWDQKSIQVAACVEPPVSEKEMNRFLEKYSATSIKTSASVFGFNFKNENPEKVRLFRALVTASDDYWFEGSQVTFKSRCDKVDCALNQIFGRPQGLRLMYMLARFGLNGSHLRKKDMSPWQTSELDDVIRGFSDAPWNFHPVGGVGDTDITHYKRGYVWSGYPENEAPYVAANAVIVVFDLWGEFDITKRRYLIFHELAHKIGNRRGLDGSAEWLNVAGWKKRSVTVNGQTTTDWTNTKKSGLPSLYAGTHPAEDFAETFSAYRYNPRQLKKVSPERYEFMKNKVFGGIEYTNDASCSRLATEKRNFDRQQEAVTRRVVARINSTPIDFKSQKSQDSLLKICMVPYLWSRVENAGFDLTGCLHRGTTQAKITEISKALGEDIKYLDPHLINKIAIDSSRAEVTKKAFLAAVRQAIKEMLKGAGISSWNFETMVTNLKATPKQFCERQSRVIYLELEYRVGLDERLGEQNFSFDQRDTLAKLARQVCMENLGKQKEILGGRFYTGIPEADLDRSLDRLLK